MDSPQAILAFSQSEKIKSALIWISQAEESLQGFDPLERQGAERIIRDILSMIAQETRLANKVSPDPAWNEVETHIDQALVMINSGVAPESVYHLTQAISRVTSMGHRAMTLLKDQALL